MEPIRSLRKLHQMYGNHHIALPMPPQVTAIYQTSITYDCQRDARQLQPYACIWKHTIQHLHPTRLIV